MAVVMPDLTLDRADTAVLDFLKALKATERAGRSAIVREEYAGLAGRWADERGHAPATIAEVNEAMVPAVTGRFDRALARFGQEMMYERARDALAPRRSELKAFLDAPESNAVGTLHTFDLAIPDYFVVDHHLQPGGMHRDSLIGFITYFSNMVYWGGVNDGLALFRGCLDHLPAAPWRRILDMGCGSKSVFLFKERFPEAEVYGIDLSAPLLKYAHKLAESERIPIHLWQQNAERTIFPDGSFDLVTSILLYHEIPYAAAVNAIRESFRLLAPGGWLVIFDSPPFKVRDAYDQYLADWHTRNIIEPYQTEAFGRDYHALLRDAGFEDVADTHDLTGKGGFPWFYRGRKPV